MDEDRTHPNDSNASVFDSLPQRFQGAGKRNLSLNILLFCRILRRLKINVTVGRMIDVFKSLKYINLSNKDELYYTLRANLVSCYEEIPVFDRTFHSFWVFFKEAHDADNIGGAGQGLEKLIEKECLTDEWPEEIPDDDFDPSDIKEVCQYSPVESLASKDFSAFTFEEIEQIKEAIAEFVNKIASRKSRRRRLDPKGRVLSLGRTLRKSMKYGGEIIELAWTKRKIKKVNLVSLADVSGSMDCYTNFFIQFIYSLQKRIRGVESFVFSTRLTRITDLLIKRDIDEALRVISEIVLHWSGGTNIGACLENFNDDYAPSVLNDRSMVIIISDGWDRGDSELLEREIVRLKNKCAGIIWLNPLLSNPDYQPLCKGIQAVLPHLSYFLPFYNLNSLKALGRTLTRIPPRYFEGKFQVPIYK